MLNQFDDNLHPFRLPATTHLRETGGRRRACDGPDYSTICKPFVTSKKRAILFQKKAAGHQPFPKQAAEVFPEANDRTPAPEA